MAPPRNVVGAFVVVESVLTVLLIGYTHMSLASVRLEGAGAGLPAGDTAVFGDHVAAGAARLWLHPGFACASASESACGADSRVGYGSAASAALFETTLYASRRCLRRVARLANAACACAACAACCHAYALVGRVRGRNAAHGAGAVFLAAAAATTLSARAGSLARAPALAPERWAAGGPTFDAGAVSVDRGADAIAGIVVAFGALLATYAAARAVHFARTGTAPAHELELPAQTGLVHVVARAPAALAAACGSREDLPASLPAAVPRAAAVALPAPAVAEAII